MNISPRICIKAKSSMCRRLTCFINVIAGYGGYHVHYTDEPGTDKAGNPSSQELTTKLLTGPNDFPDDKPQNRYEARGTVSYVTGRHQFKFGTRRDVGSRQHAIAAGPGRRRLPSSFQQGSAK